MTFHNTYLRYKKREAKTNTNLLEQSKKRLSFNKLILLLDLLVILSNRASLPSSLLLASCNLSLGNLITFNAKIEFK